MTTQEDFGSVFRADTLPTLKGSLLPTMAARGFTGETSVSVAYVKRRNFLEIHQLPTFPVWTIVVQTTIIQQGSGCLGNGSWRKNR